MSKTLALRVPAFIASLLAATSIGFAADTNTVLSVSADAHVGDGGLAKKNFGIVDPLEVMATKAGRTTEAYLRFDIPADQKPVAGAKLRLAARVDKPGKEALLIRSVAPSDWAENVVIWPIKPDHLTSLGEIGISGVSYSWYELDVTSYVQEQLKAGAKSITLVAVHQDTSPNRVLIHSRESGTSKPELILVPAFVAPIVVAKTLPPANTQGPTTPTTPRPANTARTTAPSGPVALKINFQPLSLPAPAGYLIDGGEVFGERGNGWSYGWTVDRTDQARDRSTNEPAVKFPDARYGTVIYTHYKAEKDTGSWAISLPNGDYAVRLCAGDATRDAAMVLSMRVGNQPFLAEKQTSSHRWVENVKVIKVTNGRLTVATDKDSKYVRLCFIEIYSDTSMVPSLLAQIPATSRVSGTGDGVKGATADAGGSTTTRPPANTIADEKKNAKPVKVIDIKTLED